MLYWIEINRAPVFTPPGLRLEGSAAAGRTLDYIRAMAGDVW